MPWEPVTPSSGSWATLADQRTYATSYYSDDDYVADDEWTLADAPAQEWSQAA